jgi:hypothetical protein
MTYAAIRQNMLDSSDADLMAIATGAARGYTPVAQDIAAEVLRERGVRLSPRDLREQREQSRARQAEEERLRAVPRVRTVAEEAEVRRKKKTWGIRLLIIGLGSFLLPLVGLQFRILSPFGPTVWIAGTVCVFVGLMLVGQADSDSPNAPEHAPQDEH